MNKVSIIGAGGHARSLITLMLEHKGYDIEGVYDNSFDHSKKEIICGVQLKNTLEYAINSMENRWVIAIGDVSKRFQLIKKFTSRIIEENLISSHAVLRGDVKLGKSNQIFPFVFLNAGVEIDSFCIINSRATIEHESKIGSFTHVSVGANICGRVNIGKNCFIGAGSTIKNNVTITDGVTIGAGAIVVKDIDKPGVYVGNPARKI